MRPVTTSSGDHEPEFGVLPTARALLEDLECRLAPDGAREKPIASERLMPWVFGGLFVLLLVILTCTGLALGPIGPTATLAFGAVSAYWAMGVLAVGWLATLLYDARRWWNLTAFHGDMLDGERRAELALIGRLRSVPADSLRELGERVALQVRLLKFRATAGAVVLVLIGAMNDLVPRLIGDSAAGATALVPSPDMSLIGLALLLAVVVGALYLQRAVQLLERLSYVLGSAAAQVLLPAVPPHAPAATSARVSDLKTPLGGR